MDPEEYRELHKACEATLNRYMKEAEALCTLLGKVEPVPSSLKLRSEIMQQRLRENQAQADYAEVRRRLFDAARLGYEWF
jgi:hypothetical protein